jgi:hypothetical protein
MRRVMVVTALRNREPVHSKYGTGSDADVAEQFIAGGSGWGNKKDLPAGKGFQKFRSGPQPICRRK